MITALLLPVVFFVGLFLVARLVGAYMLRCVDAVTPLPNILVRIEETFLNLLPNFARAEMTWSQYAIALVLFQAATFFWLYALLCMSSLVFAHQPKISHFEAFQIATSFVTNTGWRSYVVEQVFTTKLQLFTLLPVMFTAPAVALCVAWCLMRACRKFDAHARIGNFYIDFLRASLFILLPLATLAGGVLGLFGVLSSLVPSEGMLCDGGIFQAPLSAFVAISHLGSNGTGFFSANFSHPLQNPSPWTHLFELFLLFLVPTSLLQCCGLYLKKERFVHKVYVLCAVLFSFLLFGLLFSEKFFFSAPSPDGLLYENIEGKEIRIGSFWSLFSLLAAAFCGTSAVACAPAASMPMSLAPLLAIMPLRGAFFGSVGVGYVTFFAVALIGLFLAYAIMGHSLLFFGKKVGKKDLLIACGIISLPALVVLVFVGTITLFPLSTALMGTIYEAVSCATTSGTSLCFPQHEIVIFFLSVLMWIGQLVVLLGGLMLAGRLVQKKAMAESFVKMDSWAVSSWIVVVAFVLILLQYLPLIMAGPCYEQLSMLWKE